MLRVNGGPAHSGTVVKRERGGTWTHVCLTEYVIRNLDEPTRVPASVTMPRDLPGYWVSCPDCGTKRP